MILYVTTLLLKIIFYITMYLILITDGVRIIHIDLLTII